jgi:hypothetical protein
MVVKRSFARGVKIINNICMKKIFFIYLMLFGPSSFAQSKQYASELKCLRAMTDYIDSNRYKELENRGTAIFMIKETLPPGKFSTELNEGFLQIEKNKVKFCKLPWNREKPVSFTVEDGAGSTSLTYAEAQAPHFSSLGYLKAFAKGASKRACLDQTGSIRTNEMLKSIILSAYEKGLKNDPNFKLSSDCEKSAGITLYDRTQIEKKLLPAGVQRSDETNVSQ